MSPSSVFFDLLFDGVTQARGARIALFGAGGKTSLLHALGQEFAREHARVLLSSLTKAVPDERFPLLVLNDDTPPASLPFTPAERLLALLRSGHTPGKHAGLEPEQLRQSCELADLCIFENDGAAKHPLKVHRPPDPRVPDWSTHCVILVGAEVLDAPIGGGLVHRPEAFCAHWGWHDTDRLDEERLCRVLLGPRGYRAMLPAILDPVYLVNKADRWPAKARRLARALRAGGAERVHLGSLQEGWHERVQ
ncbi:MAG: putative selenium-dependent hydroxylase accessory protein YqeC [Candidatus Delongbacteria bacterium]|nr:putative selenium-dependent hydroxylase accessory protein YqeC [Candidatus Delongbacteria bacterium]